MNEQGGGTKADSADKPNAADGGFTRVFEGF